MHKITPHAPALVLGSSSEIRQTLLCNAGLTFQSASPNIDEELIRRQMIDQAAKPSEVACAIAREKAAQLSQRHQNSIIITCDQVLEFQGRVVGKSAHKGEAMDLLQNLSGKRHRLTTSTLLSQNGDTVWDITVSVELEMWPINDAYLRSYVDRNWDSIRHAVGCYKLEEEGARLFRRIEGDYFHVLGLPVLELLDALVQRGIVER